MRFKGYLLGYLGRRPTRPARAAADLVEQTGGSEKTGVVSARFGGGYP